MATKVWQAEAVKSHLRAAREGVRAGLPFFLVQDSNGHSAAYFEGAEVALRYLAERFGISLDNGPPQQPQISELRLKTWSREEIKSILEEIWEMILDWDVLFPEQTIQLATYYQGIEKTISYLARSFGIKDLKKKR